MGVLNNGWKTTTVLALPAAGIVVLALSVAVGCNENASYYVPLVSGADTGEARPDDASAAADTASVDVVVTRPDADGNDDTSGAEDASGAEDVPRPEDTSADADAGACTNAADRTLLAMTDVSPEAGEQSVQDVARSCGLTCLGADDRRECAADCIAEEAGLTVDCSDCHGGHVYCTVEHCLAPCASEPSGEACLSCVSDSGCDDVLQICTGV